MKRIVLVFCCLAVFPACYNYDVKDEMPITKGIDFDLCLSISKNAQGKGRSDMKRKLKALDVVNNANTKAYVEGVLMQGGVDIGANLAEGLNCYKTGYDIGYHNPDPSMQIYQ